MRRFKISVTGCGLGDFIYNGVDFSSANFMKYKSVKDGDGGLSPGKLVFKEELENFSKKSFRKIISELTAFQNYQAFNIGGPALVSAIAAKQLLYNQPIDINYYGVLADDEKGAVIIDLLNKLRFDTGNIQIFSGETPYTDVLCDAHYNNNQGERIFINNIGCAEQFTSKYLDDNFWNANLIVFGGTALYPQIHVQLSELLAIAKRKNAITILHTVYDYINEKKKPNEPWPLGNTSQSLPLIDLLIMDYEESAKISGAIELDKIIYFFKKNGSNAFIITRGSESVYVYSSGVLFPSIDTYLSVCEWISNDLKLNPQLKGDTTGCGDNFVGAVIASVSTQIISKNSNISLYEAAKLGIVSGGLTCYNVGGTYFEKYIGERLIKTLEMLDMYNLKIDTL